MDRVCKLVDEAIKLRKLHQPNATIHIDIQYDGTAIDFMFVVNGKILVEVFEHNIDKGIERFGDLIQEWILHEKEICSDED